jgi:hypothetical protein
MPDCRRYSSRRADHTPGGRCSLRRAARLRRDGLDARSGLATAKVQIAAFRELEKLAGERFGDLKSIRQAVLVVVNGIFDELIPIRNFYWLVENLPHAMLVA